MNKERFKIIPTSHLILVNGNKILLQRRFNTGYEDGKYSVCAGHLDGNETFREAREEIGIAIKLDDLEIVHVMHRKVPYEERIDFFIRARKWEGEPQILEQNKCDDLQWFELNNLPQNIIPYVKEAICTIKNRKFYSEFGW